MPEEAAMTQPPPGPPTTADPPQLMGVWAWFQPYLRPAFRLLNRRFMLPLHRAGLGAWLGTPVMSYMLLLRVRGRKSGLVRETPLSYLVEDGSAWVLAGFGHQTEWYRNLLVDPHVEALLPGRLVVGTAVEALDPAVRARIVPRLVRAMGLVGFTIGCNPWTAADERVLAILDWVPLVRITPDEGPLEAGPDDPGGRAWIWRQGLVTLASVAAWRLLRRATRRGRRCDCGCQPAG